MAEALLVMDMQRDFLEDAGRMPVRGVDVGELIAATNSAIARSIADGKLVVYIVTEFAKGDFANLFRKFAAVRGSRGCELDPRVSHGAGPVFSKAASDAFSNPELHRFLCAQKVSKLAICGVYVDQCVAATARAAGNLGYQVTILEKAVATSSQRKLTRAIEKYRASGISIA